MQISEYQRFAETTAIYPDSAKLAYPTLGLVNEGAELMEKIFQAEMIVTNYYSTGEDVDEATGRAFVDSLVDEIGDVLWYCARTASDAGLELHECVNLTNESWFSDIIASNCTISDVMQLFNADDQNLLIGQNACVIMMVCMAKIAAAAKKSIRDTNGEVNAVRREIIKQNLGHIMRLLVLFVPRDQTIDFVASKNRMKLSSRQERGVLTGDGDRR